MNHVYRAKEDDKVNIPQVIKLLVIVLLSMSQVVCAQEEENTKDSSPKDIEAARAEMVKKWGLDGLVKPDSVDNMAKELLNRPLTDQTDDELEHLAKQANAAANFVDFILEEYQDYYRDNYRYEFVQKKVAPYHDAYDPPPN